MLENRHAKALMRVLNESIARMVNEEDECTGRFWEGRFKSQALLDEAAVLACMAYVDLNPIRAGVAELPEHSDFTSIEQCLAEFAGRGVGRPRKKEIKENDGLRKKPSLYPFNAGVELKDGEKALPFSLQDYAHLLNWTGQAIREKKRGFIPETAPPILERLGSSVKGWLRVVPEVETSFNHAIGSKEAMQSLASKLDLAWLHGQRVSNSVYVADRV